MPYLPVVMPIPDASRRRARAFTIVELLVTVGIIALLTAIVITGVRSALGTARKTRELNNMRGVHAAWYQYANTYEENLLPGYLDEPAQQSWRVNYSNTSGASVPRGLSQTYTWRLARFMDDPFGMLLAYRDEGGEANANSDVASEWLGSPALPAWMSGTIGAAGSALAYQPAFGYNAFYVGGWYETVASVPVLRYADSTWAPATGGTRRGGLVATRLSGINRTSELAIFVSSTLRSPGTYRDTTSGEDDAPGNAWATPPILGSTVIWEPFLGVQRNMDASGTAPMPAAPAPQSGGTDTGVLQVNAVQGVPIRRHNRLAAVLRADGSTESASIAALLDMRLWIDAADRADFEHLED